MTNLTLKFFSTPEGYAELNLKGFDYIYQYKDHLGNVRLSYKDNNGTLEIIDEIDKVDSPNTTKYFIPVRQNNYYPLG